MDTTLIVQLEYKIQSATGPNPRNQEYELIDSDGDRMAYVDSVSGAVEILSDEFTGAQISDIEVISTNPLTHLI